MKLYKILTFIICLFPGTILSAQEKNEFTSPYETNVWKDGAYVATGVGLNILGVLIIQNKDDLTEHALQNLSKENLWKVDRWAAGYYSEKANSDSYIPMFGAFAMPIALMLNKIERQHAGQIAVLYVEAMAVTGALFSITAGLVEKSRPLVYNTSIPFEERLDSDEQRSFFAGHTASTAAATFFVAKVYSDFNPDSELKPFIWAAAAAVPATVGYLRIRAGKHFLTDNLIGYAVGAASGILIPELHKRTNERIDIYPAVGFHHPAFDIKSTGIGINYKL